MLVTQVSYPRKRQNSEQLASLSDEAEHASKKRKRTHLGEPQYRPAFWDNLSKVDLTKLALKELDRRNKVTAWDPRTPNLQVRRRITRRARAQLEDRQLTHTATHFLNHCGARSLNDIKQFARCGGPDLSNLRSFPKPIDPLDQAMSRSQSSSRGRIRGSASTSNSQPSSSTTTTKSTGPYNRNFQQNLIDGGIYPATYRYPDGRAPAKPNNWEEINLRLSRPRPSLSPSIFPEEVFQKFVQADADASKEKQITTSVIPIIEGNIEDAKCVAGGVPFTNLDHLTDGTLVPGNPDIYYGARPEQLDRRVRDELRGNIVPSTQDDLPIAPNFFVAVKGPDGSAAVAKRQACYDGALGARGMHSLLSYKQERLECDNNAYTFTSTYHDGTLKIYTSHPLQPTESSRLEYCMHQYNTWGMTGNVETFRQGVTYYRNAREWAKEQRDEAITRANERARESQPAQAPLDKSFENAASFTSEDTLQTYTAEALSQDSRTVVTDSCTTTSHHEPGTSSEEGSLEHRRPTKRSNRHSQQLDKSQRKRHNTGDPLIDGTVSSNGGEYGRAESAS